MRWEYAPWSGPWTGPTPKRNSPFKADWANTLRLLGDETDRLDAGLVLIELGVTESGLTRNRHEVKAGHQPSHPGVRVRFESKAGDQLYATAEYWLWRANVRAIALSLQALRAVDRHGVSNGQQYVGFRPELPPPDAPKFDSAKAAIRWMIGEAERLQLAATADAATLYKRLAAVCHPDRSDDPANAALWSELQAARKMLDAAGLL